MLKRILTLSLSSFILLFLIFFSFSKQANALCDPLDPFNGYPMVYQVSCGAGNSGVCTTTSRCSFVTGSNNQTMIRCETEKTVYEATRTVVCNNDGSTSATEGACVGTVVSCANTYNAPSGCTSNATCPHPPDTLCDTYCDGNNITPGACRQVDSTCGIIQGNGGGSGGTCSSNPNTCGNGCCENGGQPWTYNETAASCAVDCDPTNFAISVTPASQTILKGGSTTYSVTVSPVSWSGGVFVVSLAANCPTGASCDISRQGPTQYDTFGDPRGPNEGDLSFGPNVFILTVYGTTNIAIGDFPIDVTAVGAGKTHTVSPTLHVVPGPPGSFSANIFGTCPSRAVKLTWTAGANATGYRLFKNTTNSKPASPFIEVLNVLSYSYEETPGTTYYYWIDSISNPSGNTSASVAAGSAVVVTICPPSPDIKAFGSDGPLYAWANQQATITWTSSSATSCTVTSSPNVGSWTGLSGSATSSALTVDTIFTETCDGAGGTRTDSVTVRIPPDPVSVTASCTSPGTTATLGWVLPSGYTLSYQRLLDTTNNTMIWYDDSYSGTSRTQTGMTAGHTYTWWMHSKEGTSGAGSNAKGVSFTCGSPTPVADIKANLSDTPIMVSYGSRVVNIA